MRRESDDAESGAPMEYRLLGRTGISVSVIGFGCAPLGSRCSVRDSLAALGHAHDAGVTLFDTSPFYGQGESETILGIFARQRRAEVVVVTKCGLGLEWTPAVRFGMALKTWARPLVTRSRTLKRLAGAYLESKKVTDRLAPGEVRASTERSLQSLGTDHVDVCLLHSPSLEVVRHGEAFAELEALRDEGKISAYGVSADTVDVALESLAIPGVSVLEVPLGVCQPEFVSPVLPEAAAKGLGVLARAPFGGGELFGAEPSTGRPSHVPTEPREALRALCAARGITIAQGALRFSIGHSGVASVVTSMTQLAHVRENVGAARVAPLTDDELARLTAWAANVEARGRGGES